MPAERTIAPGPLTTHRPSLNALTGIRFFAAFYVVLFHTRVSNLLADHGHTIAGHFVGKGYFAVPLFFMLSGFILAYTYTGQLGAKGSFRRFWEARFARLWPAYALSVVLAMLVEHTRPHLLPIAATALMVQAWPPNMPDLAGSGNFVCWSLSVEAFFYLVFPFVQPWLQRLRSSQLQITLGLMLLLAVAFNSGDHSLGRVHTGLAVYLPLPVVHLPEFFAGVSLGNLFLKGTGAVPSAGLWTYGSLLLSIAALSTPDGWWATIAALPLCGLIYGLAREKTALSRFLSTPLLILGGGISYSIYLFQLSVKGLSQGLMGALHVGSPTARMVVVFPMLTLLAWAVFRLVEEPARRALRRFFAAREARAELTAG